MEPVDPYSFCTSPSFCEVGRVVLHFPASVLLSEMCIFYLVLIKHFKIKSRISVIVDFYKLT